MWKALCTMFSGAVLFCALAVCAQAAPTAAEISGEIERLTLNDPANVYSGGVMIVAGGQVILPKNLLIDLPANRLTLQQIFAQAPADCIARGESGLAKADKCNTSGTGGFVKLSAVHTNAGNVIAGDVLIEKGTDVVSGVVSYINHTEGYFRVNGIPGDSATGSMVRLNDPTGRHTIQQGAGCAGGPNCSADPRFTLDADNYVNTFSTGYPYCIPSTVPRTFVDVLGLGTTTAQSTAAGTGDVLCPSTNRTPALPVEPPVNDSRRFAPLMVGDSINAKGNYETVNGVRFLSAHTTKILKALATQNLPTQPDYLFLQEVFLEAPGFQNQRARMLIIGMTTLAPTDVDFWTLHRDPVNNATHEFPLASVQGCDNANGALGTCSNQGLVGAGANIFRIRYDVDFLLAASGKVFGGATAKLSPCLQLQASPRFAVSNPGICSNGGATLANNFGIMSPIPHEIQARTGHRLDHPGLITLDVRGNQATNGQYLFPFGINLGGVETADFLEIDVNLLNTPRIFEGIPWNLDRRLSPGGCLNAGGCEPGPIGSFALDPFPYSGLDPRTQADFLVGGLPGGTPKVSYNDPQYTHSQLSNASNRVFSYVSGSAFGGKFNFDGNNTLLPCASGACPADPASITIDPTPALNIFPPIADEDVATTVIGVPVVIDVLVNDFPVLGTIDPATVKIASNPASGTASVNPTTGAITFTPTDPLVSLVSFTYTVANSFGSVSLPGTVTVTINPPPPVAGNDTATTSTISPVVINVIANDTASAPAAINPASLTVTTPNGGTAAANLDGTVTYTPPAIPGSYTFTYTVKNNAPSPLTSNVATVTVTVTAPIVPPTVVNDSATVVSGSSVVINVAANDIAGTNPINAASTTVAAAAVNGTAVANIDGPGTITYTPAIGFTGTDSFSYNIKDSQGNVSATNATVSVTITTPTPTETITITRAQYTLSSGVWRIDGSTTARVAGQTMKIYNSPTVPSDALTGLLATVNVDANGSFTWTSANGAALPNPLRKIGVLSSVNPNSNKREQVTVTVR